MARERLQAVRPPDEQRVGDNRIPACFVPQ